MSPGPDRVGLAWRHELAAGVLARLDRIDVVQVIADDWLDASARTRRALARLSAHVPVTLHGVGLGLASAAPVASRRLDRWARLVNETRPESWSEHLAFVRGGGVEIGHLAAPPRTDATLEGLARNVQAARRAIGRAPALENVATLLEPPGSDRDEAAFVRQALEATGCGLLLDLHNLHANAVNFGFGAAAVLDALPLERVELVHVAGGRRVVARSGESRLLDDHLHDVPGPVFALLERLAARAPGPLTVILERDGRLPPVESLLSELDAARAALARGRAVAVAPRRAIA